jgi:uncharacterized protein (TIGR02246 family)
MQNRLAALAAVVLAFSFTVLAQKPDPDVQKVAAAYEAAFNKGDSKALTAMYTADALRVGPDGKLLAGRKDIEGSYVTSFAGPLKGAKLTLTLDRAVSVTPDVKVIEGTFSLAGAMPTKGRYVNTIVRQGGQWLLAAVNARPDTPPAK